MASIGIGVGVEASGAPTSVPTGRVAGFMIDAGGAAPGRYPTYGTVVFRNRITGSVITTIAWGSNGYKIVLPVGSYSVENFRGARARPEDIVVVAGGSLLVNLYRQRH